MNQLLRALLQVRVGLLPAPAQPAPDAVGLPQIQTADTSRTTCDGMAGRNRSAISPPVRALATRRPSRRLGNGSRMSRETQVRFCESRAVRSRPATHLVALCHSREQA